MGEKEKTKMKKKKRKKKKKQGGDEEHQTPKKAKQSNETVQSQSATNEEEELRKARIASNRAARRKRIKAHTATLDDYQAEIAAQEHELAAAVQKQSEIDSKLNAADTDSKGEGEG